MTTLGMPRTLNAFRWPSRLNKFLSPAFVLFLLSPMTAELLTGSSPPTQFFQPISLALLLGLYGSGAVIVRELTFRWGKGWLAMLILGAAYGIIEEGLMVKSFFNPQWQDLGLLGTYGRWAGINWVWAEELTIFHSVFSISIPIILVSMMFPKQQSKHWVSKRTLFILGTVLAVEVGIGYLFFPYNPSEPQYLLTIPVVLGLVWAAKRSPFTAISLVKKRVPGSVNFVIIGAVGTLGFFLISWVLPATGFPVLLTMFASLGWVSLVAWIILWMSNYGKSWSNLHQLGMIAGALGFFIVLAPLQELNKNPPKNMTGMTMVAVSFAAYLGWMTLQLRHRKTNRVPKPSIREDSLP